MILRINMYVDLKQFALIKKKYKDFENFFWFICPKEYIGI